jgi:ABC-type sugar transport system ATPase subunit
MARIELVNLRKTYGPTVAVRELNCTIEDGEFVVFVGPSGCGKTTTLRLIAGFEDPDGGEIRIDGHVVNDLEPRDRGLGMVFQSHALFPHKTVAQNIEFGLRMKKVPREERARRVRAVAEMVRLVPLLEKLPSACSGGESQRVALARTLVTNPSTFLLDEPLSSLDAKLRRELRAECDRLHQELKKTFIFVTHDQEEAMTLADRIVVMRSGEIEQVGSPMEIYSNPVTDFVADFFGSPSMNLVAGEIVGDNGAPRFHSRYFTIGLPEAFAAVPAGPVTLGIRPEHLRVQRDTGMPADLVLPVRLVEPLGKDTLLYFDIGAERPFIAVSEGLALAELDSGDRVGLTLTRHCIFLFGADGRRLARSAARVPNISETIHAGEIPTLSPLESPLEPAAILHEPEQARE